MTSLFHTSYESYSSPEKIEILNGSLLLLSECGVDDNCPDNVAGVFRGIGILDFFSSYACFGNNEMKLSG